MKADLLRQEFASRGIAAARAARDVLLLPVDVAIDLVNRAALEGVPIRRLGAVPVEPGLADAPPPAEQVVDFSADVAAGHGCWEAAEAFVRNLRGRAVAFEVDLGSDPIEAV